MCAPSHVRAPPLAMPSDGRCRGPARGRSTRAPVAANMHRSRTVPRATARGAALLLAVLACTAHAAVDAGLIVLVVIGLAALVATALSGLGAP